MPGVLTVRDEGAARRYVFEQQAVVGRDPDCDIPLASRSVSRRHALVEKTPNGWVVRDLGSANGTSVAARASRKRRSSRERPCASERSTPSSKRSRARRRAPSA